MKHITDGPIFIEDGLTLKKLKQILLSLPDQDESGEDFELRIATLDGRFTNSVKEIWPLDKRDGGCDLLLYQNDY